MIILLGNYRGSSNGICSQMKSIHSFYFEQVFNKLFMLARIWVGVKCIQKNTFLLKVMFISDSILKLSIILFLSN